MYRGATDSNIKIVTNGLLEHWDAAQLRSYGGSGNTWYDLSGRGKNLTLTNGPVYSSAFGGGIVYDNVDDYITAGVSGADGNMYSSQGITLAIWFNVAYFLGNKILMYNGRVDPDGVDGWDTEAGYFGIDFNAGYHYQKQRPKSWGMSVRCIRD